MLSVGLQDEYVWAEVCAASDERSSSALGIKNVIAEPENETRKGVIQMEDSR